MNRRIDALSAADLQQLTNGYRILLNPEPEAIVALLAKVQGRSRKNLLSSADAIAVFDKVVQQGSSSAHAGPQGCPRHFSYGVTSTVVQVVRIGDGLVGCVIGRQQVMPGEAAHPPVTADPFEAPRQWLKQVLGIFWTQLDDKHTALLQRQCVAAAMAYAAGQHRQQTLHHGAARAAVRRELQLQALFKRTRPVHVSELASALGVVADELEQGSPDAVSWREFQQRWPSIASRYRRDLLPRFKNGVARRKDLVQASVGTAKYTLAFDTWAGDQTVFAGTQLVFQVCSPLLAVTNDERPDLPPIALRNVLHLKAAHSPHPASLETVGWLRVHVDDLHRLVFVDEVQSDVLEHLLVLGNDGDAAASTLAKTLADWHVDGFSSVQHWAAAIGYRVAMHSQQSAATIPDKTRSLRKWTTCYGSLIKRFKLERTECNGYPGPIHVGA